MRETEYAELLGCVTVFVKTTFAGIICGHTDFYLAELISQADLCRLFRNGDIVIKNIPLFV
jgi:hypothetical protein